MTADLPHLNPPPPVSSPCKRGRTPSCILPLRGAVGEEIKRRGRIKEEKCWCLMQRLDKRFFADYYFY